MNHQETQYREANKPSALLAVKFYSSALQNKSCSKSERTAAAIKA